MSKLSCGKEAVRPSLYTAGYYQNEVAVISGTSLPGMIRMFNFFISVMDIPDLVKCLVC